MQGSPLIFKKKECDMLTPEYVFKDVTRITPEFLKEHHIKALLLDVDNTLTAHGSQEVSQAVQNWLQTMKQTGIRMVIVSNNTKKRVQPFAQRLGLQFVSMGCKPWPGGLSRARRLLGVCRHEMAMVGDQLFTDRLAGWLYSVPVLVVEPMAKDVDRGILFRRRLEKPFFDKFYQRGGKIR